jgi:hypothetical protein
MSSLTYRSFAIMSQASGTADRGRRIRSRVKDESLVSTKADWTTASRLGGALVTALACGGFVSSDTRLTNSGESHNVG